MEVLDAIYARRSIGRLVEPAPTDAELNQILTAAAAAPDHGELKPWKFIVLRGKPKDEFGKVLEAAAVSRCQAAGTQPTPGQLEKERTKLGRAPLVLVFAAVRKPSDKIPWEEQFAAGAAAAQNALLAATALGYGSMWRTGDPAYDATVKTALGLRAEDAIVGFLYMGSVREDADKPPNRPELNGLVTEWQAEPPNSARPEGGSGRETRPASFGGEP